MFALLPLILNLVPQLADLIFGPKGGEVTTKVATIVEAVAGVASGSASTPDGSAAALATIQGRPDLAIALQQKLAELHASMQAEADRESDQDRADFLATIKMANEDTAGARSMAATGQGPMRWGALVISLVVIVVFAVTVLWPMVSGRAVQIDPAAQQIMYTAVTLVLGFWLGSSSGSVLKTAQVSAMAGAAANSIPIGIAGRMLDAMPTGQSQQAAQGTPVASNG